MTLKQRILNSKKAIIAFAAPLITVWIMQIIEPYNLGIPSALLAGGVTFALMLVFGAAVYFAENIPPELQDAIAEAMGDD